MTAGVAAATVAVEYAPVRKTPAARIESADAGRVIVKFRERSSILSASAHATGAGPQSAAVLGTRLGLNLVDGRSLGPRTQVVMGAGLSSSALAATVGKDPDVEWAEVDHRRFVQAAPNDPLYPGNLSTTTFPNGPVAGQWYLRAPDATVKSSINIEPAWALTTGSSATVVADVDTGITSHPDLDSKILPGYDFIADVPTANDGDGRDSDPSDPGDWITAADDAGTTQNGAFKGCGQSDSSWHGTLTAGLLGAATNNGVGMAGVGYDTKVIPARALGKCGGFDSDIIAAAEWAGGLSAAQSGVSVVNANPARVINMSLGGTGDCTAAYQDALTMLRNNGVVVVVAAGNDEGLVVDAPANCQPAASDPDQTPLVVAVAGLRHAGTKVGFSDIGPQVTVAAPGGNCVNTDSSQACQYPILSTSNTGLTSPIAGGATYTTSFGDVTLGTSFSTPMVSGTVALMLSVAPQLTNAQVISILKSTATVFPTTSDTVPTPPVCTVPVAASGVVPASPIQDECICTTSTCGAGMLNAGAAVTAAAAVPRPLPFAIVTGSTSIVPGAVTVGNSLTLTGSSSVPSSGGSLATNQWSITNGNAFAMLGSTTGSSVTLTGVGAGTVTVQLTVTDSKGGTSSASRTVTVNAAPATGSSGGGGGGGGASNPVWLLGLALAWLLLGPRARRDPR